MMPKLPPVLTQLVAEFIPDTATFFALLDAFHDTDALAPFRPLWLLGRMHLRTALWPRLRLLPHTYDLHLAHLQLQAVHLHPYIEFHCAVASRLPPNWASHLIPSPDRVLSCIGCPTHLPPGVLWSLTNLARIPITHITWTTPTTHLNDYDSPHRHLQPSYEVLKTLVSLPHLVSLHLDNTHVPSLAPILAYVATSSKVVDLSLTHITLLHTGGSCFHDITRPMLDHLVAWLTTHPVRSLALSHWILDNVDPTPFYNTWSTCKTLSRLCIRCTRLRQLRTHVFSCPISMHHLALDRCNLVAKDMPALASGLYHSKIDQLELSRNAIGDKGCRRLFDALPRGSRLTHLHLDNVELSPFGVVFMVRVIAKSMHLRSLSLAHNRVDGQSARALIAAMTRRRCEDMRTLCLDGNTLVVHDSKVTYTQALAKKSGIDLHLK
ncbi:Aste57867_858 [Aphanomyces stellatus]|uniref:Aste57867_858 protein n=1 Tax=Aphanomyces stellatus TaxID=120398 RepID=A0A485K8Y6_9STRA|nr:hypothetical protein As57867_000857 [Aphanomyces stellatus]VFT78082.1 Aste57867_858 [Aphanomyces stellatus]